MEGEGEGKVQADEPLKVPESLFALLHDADNTLLARSLLVANHSSADAAEKCVQSALQKGFAEGKATGMLLVYKQCLLALIEGTSEEVQATLLGLHETVAAGRAPFSDVRVACFCDDVLDRAFPSFTAQPFNMPRESRLELAEDDITPDLYRAYANCVQVGTALGTGKKTPADIKASRADLFLSSERIVAIAKHPLAMTLDDFADLYSGPVAQSALADETWPMQSIMQDIN